MEFGHLEVGSKPAPGTLRVVQAFVNTVDLEAGIDELATPEALAAWLERARLPQPESPSQADLAPAIEFREALRRLLLAKHEGGADTEAQEVLNRAAAHSGLSLRFDERGEASLTPSGTGLDAALGVLLTYVLEAMNGGTWDRLKVCRRRECLWAFYDHSRNRSGNWCTMAVCGNRTKVKSYRQRTAGARRKAS
ncbi:MAG: CGNR zinc finger domain-containing protein [Actinomycetota bacterium]